MQRSSARYHSLNVALVVEFIAALALLISGCAKGFERGYASYISAPSSTVRVSQTLQLNTQTKVTGSPMSFWVNGIQGGDATVGTIDSNGL